MKLHIPRQVAAALAGAAALLGAATSAQAQVTVTANPWYNNVTVGAPLTQGVYGQIVLGNASVPPPVYSSAPVIIERTAQVYDPMYLYVPPGHRKKWSKHCSRYNACNRPVYFVNAASPRAYATHAPAQRVIVREPVVVNRPVLVREHDGRYDDDKHERKEMRKAEKEYRKAVREEGKYRGWNRGNDNDQGWGRGNQGNNGKHLGWERGRGNKHDD